MTPVLIALGSNLGERLARLREAVRALSECVCVERVSAVYETAPMYVEDQPPFLNAALLASTDHSPMWVLRALKRIEGEVGRRPRERFGPREIDLDLIAYGALQYEYTERGTVRLSLPHPRAHERRFVLLPLMDLAPGATLPPRGKVASLLRGTDEQEPGIRRLHDAHLSV